MTYALAAAGKNLSAAVALNRQIFNDSREDEKMLLEDLRGSIEALAKRLDEMRASL